MHAVSYDRHRFPPEIIRHAIWLYFRFTLSYRDVEELLAERGLDILRDGPAMGTQVRSGIRRKFTPAAAAARQHLAHRRNGDLDPHALITSG
jgi:transposase-like protein